MFRARRLVAFVVPTAFALSMCQQATHLRVEVVTDAKCSDIGTTTIAVGELGAIETRPPTSAVHACDAISNEIGTLVVVPSGDDDGEVALKVVTGVRKNAEDCAAPDYKGCIVARRALRFVPHEEVTVRIVMGLQCLDVPCGALDSCFQGKCVSAKCAGADDCPSPSRDAGVSDASGPESGVPDADQPDTTVAEAAPPDADLLPDVTCGSCPSSLHQCVATKCTCPAGSCTLGARRCNATASSVEQCALDVPGGCSVWTPSSAAADTCGSHQSCVATSGGTASCACVASVCTSTAPTCASSSAAGTCAQDANGCFFVAATSSCVGPQTCQINRCGCDSRSDCLPNNECSPALRTCLPDASAPSVERAFLVASDTVRVQYSEPVTNAGVVGAYCIEVFDGSTASCTATSDFAITSVTALDARTYDVKLTAAAPAKRYSIKATNVFDTSGNQLGSPANADFTGADALRVVSARALAPTTFELVFSSPVVATPNGASSAACNTAIECAKRYKVVGTSSLGAITSAVVQPAPDANRVILSHATPQSGGLYTVLVANNTNADGFNDTPFGAIGRLSPAGALQTFPSDRAIFMGTGTPITSLSQGPFAEDVFGDATTGHYVFTHRGRVYVGQNKDGRAAVRFRPQGDQPELVTFAFTKDTTAAGGSTSDNLSTAPYSSIGFAGCVADVSCGPDDEDGRGRFAGGMVAGAPWLVFGGTRSTGGLDYFYMSSDDDARLDFKYVDVTANTGGNTRGVTEIATFNDRVYLGLADTGGKKPYLLTAITPPGVLASGLDATTNGTTACLPATHQVCDLGGGGMIAIGGSTFIDTMHGHGDRLYIADSSGIVRSRNNAPLDYATQPTHWTAATPTAAAYTSKPSITSTKTSDVFPSDKAWPSMATYQGKLYAVRNTTSGPQLWRCDANVSSAPAPATAADCDPDDWVHIAKNTTGDALLSQFNDPTLSRATLLRAVGSYLYIGFDGPNGVAIFRTNVATPTLAANFEGDAGCVAGSAGCKPIGTVGFARVGNTRVYESVVASDGAQNFLYLVTGNGTVAARVYRMMSN